MDGFKARGSESGDALDGLDWTVIDIDCSHDIKADVLNRHK